MADPLCLDHDGHYMDNPTNEFMKMTSSISQAQSTATTHSVTTYRTSSDHKHSEGSKRNKFSWNFFNYYNSPSIPETNEDEDNKTCMNGSTVPAIPPAPPVPTVREATTPQPVSSGPKTKVKPGSSLSAEVSRQQLTGAQFSSISHVINSSEVAKYFEPNQSGEFVLKKANSLSDFDLMKEPFRERTNSGSSSTSLPPTPVGSPKQLRRSSSASSLRQLDQVTDKMRDERFFQVNDPTNALMEHVKEKVKMDNDNVFQKSSEDSSLIRRSSREIVAADNKQRGVLKDAKFLEPQPDHSISNTTTQNSESLLSKIQRWGTTTQMQMRNKDVNAWAPGGF